MSYCEAPAIELPSEELLKWRSAVEVATSASQLAVCLSELERCITWEKSSSVVVRSLHIVFTIRFRIIQPIEY